MTFRIVPLVVHQAEPGRAVGKRRTENRHALLKRLVNDGVFIVVVRLNVATHLLNELP